MFGALVGNHLSSPVPPQTATSNHMRSQLSSRGGGTNTHMSNGYRLSKQERFREREVNMENSILLSKMLDIIKRKRGSAQITSHKHDNNSAIIHTQNS